MTALSRHNKYYINNKNSRTDLVKRLNSPFIASRPMIVPPERYSALFWASHATVGDIDILRKAAILLQFI